jgi:hypothetical protein
MRFGQGLAFAFSEIWALLEKGWWLALLPPLPLLVYSTSAEAVPQDWHEVILWSTLVGMAALQAATPYWVMRFMALNHDFAAALSVDRDSARTFAPYFATAASLNLAFLAGATFLAEDEPTSAVLAATALIVFLLLSPWSLTAPSGSTVIGPFRSARLVMPHLLWAVAFAALVLIPFALVEFVASGALLALPHTQIAGQSPSALASYGLTAIFSALTDLALVVSMFIVAHRAGVRISAGSNLTAVFD